MQNVFSPFAKLPKQSRSHSCSLLIWGGLSPLSISPPWAQYPHHADAQTLNTQAVQTIKLLNKVLQCNKSWSTQVHMGFAEFLFPATETQTHLTQSSQYPTQSKMMWSDISWIQSVEQRQTQASAGNLDIHQKTGSIRWQDVLISGDSPLYLWSIPNKIQENTLCPQFLRQKITGFNGIECRNSNVPGF